MKMAVEHLTVIETFEGFNILGRHKEEGACHQILSVSLGSVIRSQIIYMLAASPVIHFHQLGLIGLR